MSLCVFACMCVCVGRDGFHSTEVEFSEEGCMVRKWEEEMKIQTVCVWWGLEGEGGGDSAGKQIPA